VSSAQELVNALQVLQVVAPAMHLSVHSKVILPFCFYYLDSALKRVAFHCDFK